MTVARISGGTSVNAIPRQAWIELDVRGESAGALTHEEARVPGGLERAVRTFNAAAQDPHRPLTPAVEIIGEGPHRRDAARRAAGLRGGGRHLPPRETPELASSSTHANLPIALGIPAIALGAGGSSGNTHTTEEEYSDEGGREGIETMLLTLLQAVGRS